MRSSNGRALVSVVIVAVHIAFAVLVANVRVSAGAAVDGKEGEAIRDECGHTLARPTSFFRRHFDVAFLKKFFKHWVPFTDRARVKMQFFLYKRDFPDCGREIVLDEYATLECSGFNAAHPTRIIIHGWLSQSKGSFNRAVKNAYLSLTKPPDSTSNTISQGDADDDIVSMTESTNSETNSSTQAQPLSVTPASAAAPAQLADRSVDFNIIVVDWSVISSNVNYFGVVELVDDLGFLVAEFVRFLHLRAGLHFDDVYLVGHSLGAQIAGSAGKQVRPFRFNTIFALDAAGPKFRDFADDRRIDPSDAFYVESIQTSSSLGIQEPVGHATFYPNFGRDQKKCYLYGCSHSRAHNYFAESITSSKGFWGSPCERQAADVWIVDERGAQFRMGGEPSTPKNGTFYVKTNDEPPYALGPRLNAVHADQR